MRYLGEREVLIIRVPPGLKKLLKKISRHEKKTLQSVVVDFIEQAAVSYPWPRPPK